MSIKLPSKLFRGTISATAIVNAAKDAYDSYWEKIKIIERHIGGEKPFKPKELADRGLSWSSNWNFNKGRNRIEKMVVNGSNEVSSAVMLGFPEFDMPEKEDGEIVYNLLSDRNTSSALSDIFGMVFNDMLLKEARWGEFVATAEYSLILAGWSAIIRDDDDWMGIPVHPRKIGFEPKSKPTKINGWVLSDYLSARELWYIYEQCQNLSSEKIKDDDGKTVTKYSNGYVKEGIEEIIKLLYCQYLNKNQTSNIDRVTNSSLANITWPDVTKEINAFIGLIDKMDGISLKKVFIKEPDKTISEIYVTFGNDLKDFSDVNNGGSCERMLYINSISKKENLDYYIQVIKDSGFNTDEYIHELKGPAVNITQDSLRYNRTRNSLENKLLISGQPVFFQNAANAASKFRFTPLAGYNVASEGFSSGKDITNFNLQDHINSIRFAESEFRDSFELHDASLTGRLTNRPTKDEVLFKQQEARSLKNSKSTVKLDGYSKILHSMFRSLSRKFNKDDIGYSGKTYFYKKIKQEIKLVFNLDLDDKDIDKIINLCEYYTIEYIINDLDSIRVLLQMTESATAQLKLKRMMALSLGASRGQINDMFPLNPEIMRNYQDERIAAFENELLWNTREIVIANTDNDVIHLDAHLSKLNRELEIAKTGNSDLVKVYNLFINTLYHCKDHLSRLANDVFQNAKTAQYVNAWKFFSQQSKIIQQAAINQAKQMNQEKQQNGGGQIPPEVQAEIDIKWWEAQQKERRTQYLQEVRKQERMESAEFNRKLQEENHNIKLKMQTQLHSLKKDAELFKAAIKGIQIAQ